ncbi:MAG: sugar ABC transporter substrate-binding protein [Christensenellales bacterium]|jgi:inositol transport system substrate-binding protein
MNFIKGTSKGSTILLALLLVLSLVLSGCGTPSEEKTPDSQTQAPGDTASQPVAEDEFVVVYANKAEKPYLNRVRDFLQKEADAAGMKLLVSASDGKNVALQISQIENYVTMGVDAIICVPVDTAGLAPTADACWQQGIPFFTVCVNTTGQSVHVGSENYKAGQMQAEYLASVLPQDGKCLYMFGTATSQETADRRDGYNTLFDLRPDLELLDMQCSNNNQDQGMNIAETWIQKYDQFDSICCSNDDAALGAIEALKGVGRLEGVYVVGLDGSLPALESIKAGELKATAFQDAEGQAKALIEMCKRVRDGEDASTFEDVFIPFFMIDESNVDSVYQNILDVSK